MNEENYLQQAIIIDEATLSRVDESNQKKLKTGKILIAIPVITIAVGMIALPLSDFIKIPPINILASLPFLMLFLPIPHLAIIGGLMIFSRKTFHPILENEKGKYFKTVSLNKNLFTTTCLTSIPILIFWSGIAMLFGVFAATGQPATIWNSVFFFLGIGWSVITTFVACPVLLILSLKQKAQTKQVFLLPNNG